MRALHYQRKYRDGTLGITCGQSGGYSLEDIARVATISLADLMVVRVNFQMTDGNILYIDREEATLIGAQNSRTRHGDWRVYVGTEGFYRLQPPKPAAADTRCHHPSCVAAGACTYGNEVARP